MNINIEKTPFSRYGSSVALSKYEGKLYLRTMYGMWDNDRVFLVTLTKDGQEIDYEISAKPWQVKLKTKEGNIKIFIKDNHTIVFESEGPELSFDALNASISYISMKSDSSLMITEYDKNIYAGINVIKGGIQKVNGEERVYYTYPENGYMLLEVTVAEEEFVMRKTDFDVAEAIFAVKKEFFDWTAGYEPKNLDYSKTAMLAAYIMWSSVLYPRGYLKRPTVLMSKNWMHYVWSWDHCFTAMALSENHPELALDQFMVLFDQQAENGKLPDMMSHTYISRMFTKPPVHGWCFLKLMEAGVPVSDEQLCVIYNKLSKWTDWWFNYRDSDSDGICQYDHGNECGWDNCTTFDGGLSVEAPELTAYLLLQEKCLIKIAEKLGLPYEIKKWSQAYDSLYEKFIQHFCDGDRLKAIVSREHTEIETYALLNYVTVVLGDLLPKNIFDEIVSVLKVEGEFLTENGLATESIKSPKYEKGRSYWRGSIWSPVIYIITDGLFSGGETELAKEIALRFCNMVNGKDGIYENYDALTGLGNDDPSYTWAAGVFLMLLKKYL